MDGGSFTGLTVNTMMLLLIPAAVSTTVTVTAAVPERWGAGVRVKVRLAPLPPSTTPVAGKRLVLAETAVTMSWLVAVLESPTVKLMGPATVSSLMVWLLKPVMVGGVLLLALI